jgi:hypothetical protein
LRLKKTMNSRCGQIPNPVGPFPVISVTLASLYVERLGFGNFEFRMMSVE